jgi:hypothetical protein
VVVPLRPIEKFLGGLFWISRGELPKVGVRVFLYRGEQLGGDVRGVLHVDHGARCRATRQPDCRDLRKKSFAPG